MLLATLCTSPTIHKIFPFQSLSKAIVLYFQLIFFVSYVYSSCANIDVTSHKRLEFIITYTSSLLELF